MVSVTKESLAKYIAELEVGPRSIKEDFQLEAFRMLMVHLIKKPELWEIENPGEGTYFVWDAPHDKDWRKDLIVQEWFTK